MRKVNIKWTEEDFDRLRLNLIKLVNEWRKEKR